MTRYEEVVGLTDQLTLTEKAKLLEYLSGILKQQLELDEFRYMPWHEFIERTAGILADDPIERPEQLPLEDREPLE